MIGKPKEVTTGALQVQEAGAQFPYARRGSTVDEQVISSESIEGFNNDRIRARTLLTAEEEKKLMHRIDWRLMVRNRFSTSELD